MILIPRAPLVLVSLAWLTAGATVGLAVGWGWRP